jgi:hypothetical protein
LVAFALGYLVVISTQLDEIGREQFCSRFQTSLRDIAYDPVHHRVAAGGDTGIKLVDMKEWKEVGEQDIEPHKPPHATGGSSSSASAAAAAVPGPQHAVGSMDKLQWSPDGRYLAVSSRAGCLFVYAVADSPAAAKLVRAGSASGLVGMDANARRLARRREAETSRSLVQRLLYKPIGLHSLVAGTSIVVLSAALALSSATGLRINQLWTLLTGACSV